MAVIKRSNYLELIPEIKEKIKVASFVCFDAEYSGLHYPPDGSATSLFDTGAVRYEKMRAIVMHNSAPQIGICIFRRDTDPMKNLYHVDAYQAHVLEPSFADFRSEEAALSLELKCGKFLRRCNFDFNALSDHSVPCLNINRVTELTQYLKMNPNFMQARGRFFDKIFFPNVKSFHDETDQLSLIQRLRGLSEIIDVITEHKIPVVGHNMALDLLYFYRLFCSDLPAKRYEAFKKSVSEVFCCIYDTKYMVVSCKEMLNHPTFKDNTDKDKIRSSSLYTAYLNTSSVDDKFKPEIILSETCTRFKESIDLGTKQDLEDVKNFLVHDPAFDACVTGIVFLNVGHISARIYKDFLSRTKPTSVVDLFLNVQAWKNQIYIPRATIIAMCLKANDPKPSRPQWIIVSSKEEIGAEDLRSQLIVFGPVDVEQVDERTVRLATAGEKSAKQMKQWLDNQGLTTKKFEIPWNRQRYMELEGRLQRDLVYDRCKLLG